MPTWWRYNPASHIFEHSLNEGTTWTAPPLNASIINEGVMDPARLPPATPVPPNIAFTNVGNQFTVAQRISNAGGDWPRLTFSNVGGGPDLKIWQIIHLSDNLNFWALNDAESTISGAVHFTRAGEIACSSISVNGNIFNTAGYMYPGRVDAGGGYQTTWYLASHGSFGLYTNSGFYVAGSLWCDGVYNRGRLEGIGIACRAGTAGVNTGNTYNFNWADNNVQVWIDSSYMGAITLRVYDRRLQRDFTPLTGSLDKIKQLVPGTFYNQENDTNLQKDTNIHFGMLAQDVMSVIPELVRNSGVETESAPDGILEFDYTEIIPMLVDAIKELADKVTALTTEVAQLKEAR